MNEQRFSSGTQAVVDVGVSVGVLVGVLVGVSVGVLVGVSVGVLVGVSVGVFVGVSVGVLVGVSVGVFVGVSVGVLVGVSVGVFVGVSVGVLVGVSVGVLVGVSVGVFVGVLVGVSVGVLVDVFVAVLVAVFVGGGGLSCRMTQSEGSEFGSLDGYEHTSNRVAVDAPTSARTILQEAWRSLGNAAPAGNGSFGCMLVEQVEENDETEVIGLVQRSALASPHVYRVSEMDASVGSVTHNEKLTFPSPSVSNKAQASRVLFPLTVTSSQFHSTVRDVGRPALSTHNRVRSFCPGSSLAPAVSLVHTSAASTDEDAKTATAPARSDAITIASIKRERDLVIPPDGLLGRSKND